MKIYALPYAAGNSSIYYNLKKMLENSVEFISLEYSGHGVRLNEQILYSVDEITYGIYKQIIEKGIDEEYCILGYSMGGIIATELYAKLATNNCNLPKFIFICACNEPGHERKNRDVIHCNRGELIDILRDYSGTPEEVFEFDEILDFTCNAG